MMRTFGISRSSSSQVHHIAALAVVVMFAIHPLVRICLRTGSLYLLATVIDSPLCLILYTTAKKEC